jgi:Asp/Glu/hydantoin racemase
MKKKLIEERTSSVNKKIAVIHTSFVFFDRERMLFELFDELLPEVERVNIVEDKMLAEVMEHNLITPDVIRRMCFYVLAAEQLGAELVFNACSSLGPAFDVARQLVKIPAIKIDDAMAEKAALHGNKIAVLATVPTTLDPTIDLIFEKAKSQSKEIEVKKALAKGAFEILMTGDVSRHDAMVIKTANSVAAWADTLVLAQCSMARLAPILSDETNLPVLSSPRLAVERVKMVLNQLQQERSLNEK